MKQIEKIKTFVSKNRLPIVAVTSFVAGVAVAEIYYTKSDFICVTSKMLKDLADNPGSSYLFNTKKSPQILAIFDATPYLPVPE